jgi:glycosyltransferase involved in cell wall biosynthesis
MIQGHDIICLSTSDWEYPIGSKQQVMLRLAKANRILYVDYQASWLHLLRYPALRYRWRHSGRVKEIAQGLWTYTPRLSLPFGPYALGINSWNQRKLKRELQETAGRLGFKRPILWVYTPLSQPLIGRMDEKLVVYHCISEYPLEKPSHLRQQTLDRLEDSLARQSDVVFAISTQLMEKLAPLTPRLYYLPSGVDWKRFEDPRRIVVPPEVEAIPGPRLGIAGIINDATDLDTVEELASRRPDWTFIHVGSVVLPRSKEARLRAIPNLVSFGRQPYDAVPGFIAGMDVCLLPLVDTLFTRSMSSLRLMEYLALGRPVVASDLPDVKAFGDVVASARGTEEFMEAIEAALKDDDPERIEARRSVARAHSWDTKVETICEAISDVLNK